MHSRSRMTIIDPRIPGLECEEGVSLGPPLRRNLDTVLSRENSYQYKTKDNPHWYTHTHVPPSIMVRGYMDPYSQRPVDGLRSHDTVALR